MNKNTQEQREFDPRQPEFYLRILELAAKSAMDSEDVLTGLKVCFNKATNGKLLVMTAEELAGIKGK